MNMTLTTTTNTTTTPPNEEADDPYRALNTIILPAASGHHSATVILLHGLGDRGANMRQACRYMLGRDFGAQQPHLRHVRFLIPSAPKQPFTMFGGRPAFVWVDVQGRIANIDIPERRGGLVVGDRMLGALIDAEVRTTGVPIGRIAVAGFSMGGIMAVHAALRLRPGLAACCSMSMFLNYDNAVFDRLRGATAAEIAALPPVLMVHGTEDQLMDHRGGRVTYEVLRAFGVRAEFRSFVGMRHEMRANVLLEVERWLAERLPALPDDVVHKL